MPVLKENTVSCPVCSESAGEQVFRAWGRSVLRCRGCSLLSIFPQPSERELEEIYTGEYYRSWGIEEDPDALEKMKLATFFGILERIEGLTEKGRLLDIGCAAGFSLTAATKMGWEAYGVELSSYSASMAARRSGAGRVFCGRVDEASYPNGFFSAVMMTDLIEHVTDPASFLAEVRRILAPNGVVLIVTPDAGSLTCRTMGHRWPHFKLEHLYYYNRKTLSRLLERHGFATLLNGPAKKALSLSYAARQFVAYPIPLVTQFFGIVNRLLPDSVRNRPMMVHSGELLLVARRQE